MIVHCTYKLESQDCLGGRGGGGKRDVLKGSITVRKYATHTIYENEINT